LLFASAKSGRGFFGCQLAALNFYYKTEGAVRDKNTVAVCLGKIRKGIFWMSARSTEFLLQNKGGSAGCAFAGFTAFLFQKNSVL
jgi:hypothetical protein